jgi:hypothetical protein
MIVLRSSTTEKAPGFSPGNRIPGSSPGVVVQTTAAAAIRTLQPLP